MASISQLREAILTAFNARGSQNAEQELFQELMANKQLLLKLHDVGPRNPQEQRELESGKIVVNGRPLAVNADFARQAVFISQQLDCSERYVAGLLQDVMAQSPNLSQERYIEGAIMEFHYRRRQMAECLRYIFEGSEVSEDPDAPRFYVHLDVFVRQQLIFPAEAGGISFVFKVFQQVHNLGNVLAKAQAARQNARSDTIIQGTNATLGSDVLGARCESLKYERRTLATVLYMIGRVGYLAPEEIRKMIDWLDANPRHSMTYYILPAVLAAFDIVDPSSVGGQSRNLVVFDKAFVAYMKKKLDVTTEWKEPGLKATILLKWTLLLTDARRHNATLENAEGFKTEELETQIWNAVQGDCFTYLVRLVGLLQKKQVSGVPVSYAGRLVAQAEQDNWPEQPADDFKPVIFGACEVLVRSLITQASSELRKIKQRQEDLLLAGTRTDRTRMFRGSTTTAQTGVRFAASTSSDAEKPNVPPRHDLAVLFSFIGLLYATLPEEKGLHYWGGGVVVEMRRSAYNERMEVASGKLPAFLQWAVWSTQARDLDMSTALYDMLAGLAKGQQCSELAYNFLARGGGEGIAGNSLPSTTAPHLNAGTAVSWSTIFGLLESWAQAGLNHRPQAPPQNMGPPQQYYGGPQAWQAQQPHQHHPQLALTQQDVILAQAFLRLLATVVTHSAAVRIAIVGLARFRAIPSLVSLIPLGVPLELKGAIFETLAAFCEAGAGIPGVEICRSVWTLMERMEVINVRVAPGSSIPAVKGVEVELDEVEAVYKMYPATIPFLKLLSTLIHTPKDISLRDRVADAEPINTIPETLGQPYRAPGIGPFSSFVIDNVFARINNREYLRPSDRWRTIDLCLSFVERSLASYELEYLITNVEELQPKGDAILQLAIHPGYDMMKRILSPSQLQGYILSYLVDGLNGFERGFAEDEPYFRTTIVRVLRIILRVLDIQDIFLDVLIPLLSEAGSSSVIGEVQPASYFIRLDHALSFSHEHIPALAAYVAYTAYPELILLSVKILTALSASNSSSQLAVMLERSDESMRMLEGFQQIVDVETLEDVEASEATAEQRTGAGAPDLDDPSPLLTQAIRLALLDLFIQNTHPDRPYPNVAHLLLFGGITADSQIQDPHALGARRSCVHSILELLNVGVPRLKGKAASSRQLPSAEPLFITLPALAERCYHVIFHLCQHPRTSEACMRYLRTREDFFARHLAAIPFKVPPKEEELSIEVMYGDGSRVPTTVSAVTSFLRLRSWILDLVALELHVLTRKGHRKGAEDLLELLFGNEEDLMSEGVDGWQLTAFKPFHDIGQSHLRMIELIQSLDFDWSDSLTLRPVELQFLGELNLQSCLRVDEAGCEIVDRTALLSLLTVARRTLHMESRVITSSHMDQLTLETTYILESCAIENHRREVRYAAANGYEAWRRLLDMALIKSFDRLPHDRRENMLFDILHVLPLTLRSSNIQESTAVLLSEAMLSTITKLREDRRHQIILQSAGGDIEASTLPAERLYTLLRNLLDCILENSRVELVRGNLYASLINFFHLVLSSDPSSAAEEPSSSSDSMTPSRSRESSTFGDGLLISQLVASPSSWRTLVDGSATIVKTVLDRLVTTISRDAIDGTEVWKTVAFMLLDSMVRLFCVDKHPGVLHALARHGSLAGFVSGLKESDLRLQAVLKPDPDDLNALYVYESKISLLIRMAQSRHGAERLLEARAMPVLADCDYLDARPEADQAFLDHDSFLPSAVMRYHQLFLPALQLVSGMLITLGTKHTTGTTQALQFLSSHRDTIILLLKNEVDELSLSVLEEMRLLVSLCSNVLQLVPKSELFLTSGFGGIHGASLSLAAKCLGNRHWSESVKPQTDAELLDAAASAPGFGTQSLFRVAVLQKEQLLRKAIVTYLGAASDFTEPDFTLVMSPVVTTPRTEERSTKFLATVPTLGDAIEALNGLCDELASTLKSIVDLSAEIASKGHIRVDNIQEIVTISDPTLLENLDVRQKQSLISRELSSWRANAKRRVAVTLHSMEMLLLLLWRHLQFYGDGQHIDNPDTKGALAHTLRFASSPDVDTLRAEAARRIAPALQRLQTLDLSEETLGGDWRAYAGYIELMVRRLKDTAGLEEPAGAQDER